jgi:hypothetical protein
MYNINGCTYIKGTLRGCLPNSLTFPHKKLQSYHELKKNDWYGKMKKWYWKVEKFVLQ